MNNPFSNNSEDTSFERGTPLGQTARNAVKVAATQAKALADDTTKAFLDQLYGPSTPSTDNTDQQVSDATKQLQQTGHGQQSAALQQALKGNAGNSAKSPDEQANLEKIRRELFAKTHGGQFNIEQQMEKARKEREQKEQQLKQQEEEEKQSKEAEKMQMEEAGPFMPAGKKTGMMFGRKPKQPMAVTQAKNKAESNRGATG